MIGSTRGVRVTCEKLKGSLQWTDEAQSTAPCTVSIPPNVLFVVNDECQKLYPNPPLQVRDQVLRGSSTV